MSKTSYYKISDGTVTGSIAILDILPEAPVLPLEQLLEHGYIRFEIPDDVLTIFPRYKNGKLTITPPPYWDELKLGIAKLAIAQRLLAASLSDLAINGVFTAVSAAISFNDYASLKNALGRVVDVLAYKGLQISPEEMAELQALFLECGFTSEVWEEMID